jgi:hypothetical protein
MNTIVEFITFTKGVEYLITIAFLLCFIIFWQVMNHRGKGLFVRLVPLVVATLGIGALASTCVMEQPGKTAAANAAGDTTLLASPVLAETFGPATFDHHMHQFVVRDCTVCHHHSGSDTPACSQCHNGTSNADNSGKPELAHVYHMRCISCHAENQSGPTDCTGCHKQASVTPLSVTHPLNGKGNCLSCHAGGINGVPQTPADHTGAMNSVCQLCHTPSVEQVAIRVMPHQVAGRENCLLCHGDGIGGAARVPGDHAGRTNETCLVCHTPPTK